MDIKDKSTGKVLRKVIENGLSEARNILDKAKAASVELASMSREDVAGGLIGVSDAVYSNMGSLSRSISLETGRAIKSSREDTEWVSREFRTAAHQLFSSLAERQTVPVDTFDNSFMSLNLREPIGVVLLFTSSLEEISHSAKVIANAISAGNPVVCVPPPQAPGPFEELKIIMDSSGLPGDVFQLLILHQDSPVSRAILDEVGKVVFLGQEPEFAKLIEGTGCGKLLSMSKTPSPVIVWDDADLDNAAEYVAASAFQGYNGSYAVARKVILREDSYEYFRNRVVGLASRIKVGKADEEDVDLGPVPDPRYAKDLEKQLEEAVNNGASVAFGGNVSGAIVPPTVLDYLPPETRLIGSTGVPVLCIERVESMEAAVKAANQFGSHSQVSIFTSDIDLAASAAGLLEFSSILINEAPGSYSGFWHRSNEPLSWEPGKIVDLREEFSRTKVVKLKK